MNINREMWKERRRGMSKTPRKYSKSNIYHIIIKGIDNQNIFYDDQDRRVFLKKLLITKKENDITIYSYSLMDNHVHMVIKIEKEFLSKAMQSLMIRYVRFFNKKYERIGALSQCRFKSKNIEDQDYFLKVCRYVHRNPENAGIAKTEDYQWSSYQEYVKKEKIVDKRILLHYFNNDINEFIKYTKKCDDNESLNEFAEFEIRDKLTDRELLKIIMKIFNINDVDKVVNFFKDHDKYELKSDIEKIKKIRGTNKTQVARVIRVNRKIVAKFWDN